MPNINTQPASKKISLLLCIVIGGFTSYSVLFYTALWFICVLVPSSSSLWHKRAAVEDHSQRCKKWHLSENTIIEVCVRNRACLQKGRACVFVLSHRFSKYVIYLCYESLHRLKLGFLQILLGYVYYSQHVLERRCTSSQNRPRFIAQPPASQLFYLGHIINSITISLTDLIISFSV